MTAIGIQAHLPITDSHSLVTLALPVPVATGHDLLIAVHAVSVNPVDVGVRGGHGQLKHPRVLGWDAVGIVQVVGAQVTLFQPGDRVYYAGDFKRAGSDSQYQLVDERLVGRAPKTLTDAQAAAMPLTTLTAWEALFEKLQLTMDPAVNQGQTLLIINGAGGVGSIAIQLAKLAGLTVIATASRPETVAWVQKQGADMVLNHRQDLVAEWHAQKQGSYVDAILELNDINGHWREMAKLIKPDGRIVSITENQRPIDLQLLTKKRATFAWEWVFSKAYYQTDWMITQHDILTKVSALFDQGVLQPTLTKTLTPINVGNLKAAHQLVESHRMIGKVVVTN
ncbi:zinc-binding alcohol dehydrogenase family protein [Lactiplantibacillus daowaiensis]|uniref:Zinc-type alcohol dehydrogenase-like protein n=1 Tax=Lactiplantibacillus daowaiensis TaxID=2559918 RepID=A0ABW1S142_9LACO|nr:zinc-binding alcohol dehydrogenase family protein [Lactiplantibacillus daowaiensis]